MGERDRIAREEQLAARTVAELVERAGRGVVYAHRLTATPPGGDAAEVLARIEFADESIRQREDRLAAGRMWAEQLLRDRQAVERWSLESAWDADEAA